MPVQAEAAEASASQDAKGRVTMQSQSLPWKTQKAAVDSMDAMRPVKAGYIANPTTNTARHFLQERG